MDPLVLLPDLDRATSRLLEAVRGLSDAEVLAPSLLPNWSRGHVIAHLARNADGLGNLLTWAHTGVKTPMYASPQARDADIDAGAARAASEQVADFERTADQLARQAADMPAEAWGAQVELRGGAEVPAATLMWARLREVEIHHVDLDLGYRHLDWPDDFAHRLLHDLATDFGNRDNGPRAVLRVPNAGHDLDVGADREAPVITGSAQAVAGWLTGRHDGAGLAIEPGAALPIIPAWR
ncbi:MAG: maleylpyruvate isomerase family mycothiol-dependent enzyme [Micromonosporaceae bacterium]